MGIFHEINPSLGVFQYLETSIYASWIFRVYGSFKTWRAENRRLWKFEMIVFSLGFKFRDSIYYKLILSLVLNQFSWHWGTHLDFPGLPGLIYVLFFSFFVCVMFDGILAKFSFQCFLNQPQFTSKIIIQRIIIESKRSSTSLLSLILPGNPVNESCNASK